MNESSVSINKKQAISFWGISIGIPVILGILMWLVFQSGNSTGIFPVAWMFLPASGVMVGQLLGVVVVHHRVGDLRPAVDHVPPDDAGAPPFFDARALDEELLRLGLHDLRQAAEAVQVLRRFAEEDAHLVVHEPDAAVAPAALGQVVGVVGVPGGIVQPGRQLVLGNKALQ